MNKLLLSFFLSIYFALSLQAQEGIFLEPDTNVAEAALFEALDPLDHETALEKLYKDVDGYLMPDDHPIKPALDRIFSSSRVLASLSAMKKAGFIDPELRVRQIVIGVHPDLQGYLLKVYLDTAPVDELAKFIKRIDGARLVQKGIDTFGYQHLMNVPRKWLYQLPDYPPAKSTKKIYPKKYILVVDDMNIHDDITNRSLYKKSITHEQLDALFDMLLGCGLVDSAFVPNIPFTKEGKISFIDTEFYGKGMHMWLRLAKLAKYLGSSNAKYWKDLCAHRPRPPEIKL